MDTELGLRLLFERDDAEEAARAREATLGAAVLHLALVIMVLISPGGALGVQAFFAQPVQIVELVQAPTPLYLPPGELVLPEENTPDDLTEEEKRRAVIRNPDGEKSRDGQLFSLPVKPLNPGGGGEQTPSLVPGSPGQPDSPAESAPSGAESAEAAGGLPETNSPNGPEVALLDIPRPGASGKGLDPMLKQRSPGQVLRESILRSRTGTNGGFAGPGRGVRQPDITNLAPSILSDTRGVDFGPYLVLLVNKVRRSWYSVIPDSVRLGEQGKVVIVFSILRNGDVPPGEPTIVGSSGRSHLDRPAMASILASEPLPPLPTAFTGDKIVLQFAFLYNMTVEEARGRQ